MNTIREHRLGIRIQMPDGVNTTIRQLKDGSLVFLPAKSTYKLQVHVDAVEYDRDPAGEIVVNPVPLDERIITVRPWSNNNRRTLRVCAKKEP
jgi:hypothetical protein